MYLDDDILDPARPAHGEGSRFATLTHTGKLAGSVVHGENSILQTYLTIEMSRFKTFGKLICKVSAN